MRAELDQGGTITAQDCMKIHWQVMAGIWSNKAEEFIAEIIDDASWQKDGDKVKVKDVLGDDEWKLLKSITSESIIIHMEAFQCTVCK